MFFPKSSDARTSKDLEEEKLHYGDRLRHLIRIKRNGSAVIKGAEEVGSCKLQIITKCFGENTSPFPLILAHCESQLVLSARINRLPNSVSRDGLEIVIWLDDYSGGQNFCRKFILKFFDQVSASSFFSIYSSFCSVTGNGNKGLSLFDQLQEESLKMEKAMETRKKKGKITDESDCSNKEEGEDTLDEKNKERMGGEEEIEVDDDEDEGYVEDFESDCLQFSQDVFAESGTLVFFK